MVGVADRRERHLGAARAHRDPERRARGVRGRVGVAHYEALPLQDDWFRLVLSAARARHEPHGTQQAKRQHRGPKGLNLVARPHGSNTGGSSRLGRRSSGHKSSPGGSFN